MTALPWPIRRMLVRWRRKGRTLARRVICRWGFWALRFRHYDDPEILGYKWEAICPGLGPIARCLSDDTVLFDW